MRRATLLLILGLTGSAVRAQSAVDSTPRSVWKHAAVHYGKWVAVAGAVTFTALAIDQHQHSNTAWNALLGICLNNSQNCAIGSDGRYRYYPAEYDYQLALYYDHRARWRLVAGQVSLLAAVGLFVTEIRGRSHTPRNIPVHPLSVSVAPTPDGAAVALRLAF